MSAVWALAVDVGTTTTVAATTTGDGTGPHLLEVDGARRMPSAVWASPSGELVVGNAAEAQTAIEPDRGEPTPKRRLGDPVMLLGDRPVEPVDAVAALLRAVADAATRHHGGEQPGAVVLTHPATWGRPRTGLLQEAARRAGLARTELMSEPVAAASHVLGHLVAEGELAAVYDLGGGTFDVAVVRRVGDGYEVAGPPGGDDRVGGEMFDRLVAAHLTRGLPDATRAAIEAAPDRPWQQAALAVRRAARAAKEALSTGPTHTVYLGPPIDAEVVLERAELEELLRPTVDRTVEDLARTVERSGIGMGSLRALVLAGDASRMPLVAQRLAEVTGHEVRTWGDPKAVVALGALPAGGPRTAAPSPAVGEPAAVAAPSILDALPPRPPGPDPDPAPAPVRSESESMPEPPDPAEPEPAPGPVTPEHAPTAEPPGPGTDGTGDRQRVGRLVALGLVAAGVLCVLALLVLDL